MKKNPFLIAVIALIFILTACSSGSNDETPGTSTQVSASASTPDASTPDTSEPDTSTPDTSEPDTSADTSSDTATEPSESAQDDADEPGDTSDTGDESGPAEATGALESVTEMGTPEPDNPTEVGTPEPGSSPKPKFTMSDVAALIKSSSKDGFDYCEVETKDDDTVVLKVSTDGLALAFTMLDDAQIEEYLEGWDVSFGSLTDSCKELMTTCGYPDGHVSIYIMNDMNLSNVLVAYLDGARIPLY